MSDEATRHLLTVTTDGTAEIYVSDSQRQLVANGVGTLAERLTPGVYKVNVRQGRTSSEQLLLLEGDQSLQIQAPQIATPVPLRGTGKSHKSHYETAAAVSRERHYTLGQLSAGPESSIFIQVRYWTPDDDDARSQRKFPWPAAGLSLHQVDGSEGMDIGELAVKGSGPELDPSAACTIRVAPGAYILRARTRSGRIIEQVIYASPGWQTQVFVLRQPLLDERRRRTTTESRPEAVSEEDLFDLAITMGQGAFADDQQTHFSELARLALADERPLTSGDLHSVLEGKFDNPMLGLYGAHLLLIAKAREEQEKQDATRRSRYDASAKARLAAPAPFDQGLFNVVVDKLHDLIGGDHPDLQALTLRASSARSPRPAGPVRVPPMLRRSWSLLADGSVDSPDLIPLELWKRVVRMTPSRPFLAWFAAEEGVAAGVDDEFARELRSRLEPPQQPTAGRPDPGVGTASRALESASTSSSVYRRRRALDLDLPASAVEWLLGTRAPDHD